MEEILIDFLGGVVGQMPPLDPPGSALSWEGECYIEGTRSILLHKVGLILVKFTLTWEGECMYHMYDKFSSKR